MPQANCIFLARDELIAAWNCLLQSEKAMLAAGSVADGLADVGLAVAVGAVVAGGVARLPEVQAAVPSSATAATSTDNRVVHEVTGTS